MKKAFKLLLCVVSVICIAVLAGCSVVSGPIACTQGIASLGGGDKNRGNNSEWNDWGSDGGENGGVLSEDNLDEELANNNALSGDITISMLWNTYDDIDLHVITPNGNEIYYYNTSADGGYLDVDHQASDDNLVAEPVENIYFSNPISGQYQVYIYNYYDRTLDTATDYLVRVTVGSDSQVFTGTINDTDTQIAILTFTY